MTPDIMAQILQGQQQPDINQMQNQMYSPMNQQNPMASPMGDMQGLMNQMGSGAGQMQPPWQMTPPNMPYAGTHGAAGMGPQMAGMPGGSSRDLLPQVNWGGAGPLGTPVPMRPFNSNGMIPNRRMPLPGDPPLNEGELMQMETAPGGMGIPRPPMQPVY